MRIADDMTILCKENNFEEINKLEGFKKATSLNILHDVINGRNDPFYKILLSIDSYISTTRQAYGKQKHLNNRPASLVHKHESTTREWFYISLNRMKANKHKVISCFKHGSRSNVYLPFSLLCAKHERFLRCSYGLKRLVHHKIQYYKYVYIQI